MSLVANDQTPVCALLGVCISELGSLFQPSVDFEIATSFYEKCIEAQVAGDATGATEYFNRALAIQATRPSFPVLGPEFNILPTGVYLHVISFLGVRDLAQFIMTSQAWRFIGQSNVVWKVTIFLFLSFFLSFFFFFFLSFCCGWSITDMHVCHVLKSQ